MADLDAIKPDRSARNKISREQETLPSETWERGKFGYAASALRRAFTRMFA
jgi:hypothetical protein